MSQATRLAARGVIDLAGPHAARALTACPALLTPGGAPAAAALLAQSGVRRRDAGAALAQFGVLAAPGGRSGAVGGAAVAAVLRHHSLPSIPTTPLPPGAAPLPLPPRPVDVTLHPVAAFLVAAGSAPADITATALRAPCLLSSRRGREALDWLWARGVPAADLGAAAADLGVGLAGRHLATLAVLDGVGVAAVDGLRLLRGRARLRARGAARRARAAVRALLRAGVAPHALAAIIVAVPDVLERGLGPAPRALNAAAGEGAALVGAALAACPALARSDPAPTLAELAAWGVRRDGVLEARGL